MREILFRGKRVDNGEWIFGDLLHDRFIMSNETICQIYDMNSNLTHRENIILPETIGQYTGLTDKNGKKIFEGDYWLDTDGDYLVYVVEFRYGEFGFACYGWQGALMPYGFDEDAGGWGEIDFDPITNYNIDTIEVIGNIHDNPELLKGGAE